MKPNERQRLYGCIHDAVTKARLRLGRECGVTHASAIDNIVRDITEASFRPFVDGESTSSGASEAKPSEKESHEH